MKNLFNTYEAVEHPFPEFSDLDDFNFGFNLSIPFQITPTEEVQEEVIHPLRMPTVDFNIVQNTIPIKRTATYKGKGYDTFNKLYDEIEKEDSSAKEYRSLLTAIAKHESNFNPLILNTAGAPAFGYFLFMLDGVKWNNIVKYSGMSIEDFLNNPKEQIKAAIKFAKANYNRFDDKSLQIAKLKGITKSGLIGAAWLAGVGGTKKYLYGQGDPSDSSWYGGTGKGSSVSSAIQRYNNL